MTAKQYEHDPQVSARCELCDGTGWIKTNRKRCPCREADDEAARRRAGMALVARPKVQDNRKAH